MRTVPLQWWTRGPSKQMRPVDYNCPEMTGISVRCDPEPGHIHIHAKHDDLSFYENTPDYATWVYTGFAPGERICTIWEILTGSSTKGL